jgi:hypothetical protein
MYGSSPSFGTPSTVCSSWIGNAYRYNPYEKNASSARKPMLTWLWVEMPAVGLGTSPRPRPYGPAAISLQDGSDEDAGAAGPDAGLDQIARMTFDHVTEHSVPRGVRLPGLAEGVAGERVLDQVEVELARVFGEVARTVVAGGSTHKTRYVPASSLPVPAAGAPLRRTGSR